MEKLYFEMLKYTQNDCAVGEYVLSRYFMQLHIPSEKQIGYFIKNLRLGITESTFARHPQTLADAHWMAKEAENMYYTLFDKRKEPRTELNEIRKQVEMLTHQKAGPTVTSSPASSSSFPADRPFR
jgi:hypothetical protein